MAYDDFKDLNRGTAAEGYQHKIASSVYNFFDKKSSGCAIKNKLYKMKN